MLRLLPLLLVTNLALISGCSMCSTPYDCHYSAYGGSQPRGDRVYGRVGSAFRDAAAVSPEFIDGQEIVEWEGAEFADDGYGEIAIEGEPIGGGFEFEAPSDTGIMLEGASGPYTMGDNSELIELPPTDDGAASTFETDPTLPENRSRPATPQRFLDVPTINSPLDLDAELPPPAPRSPFDAM